MKKYCHTLIPVVLITTILSCTQKNKSSIDGTWTIAEVQTVKQDGTITSVLPTESEVIFTDNNYSFCLTTQQSIAHSWEMSDSIKLDRINNMIINAGTYELNDSVLKLKAIFALNPMFVNGLAKFRYSFSGDTLVLTGISVNSANNVPNPVYVSGSHIVNKLIRAATK